MDRINKMFNIKLLNMNKLFIGVAIVAASTLSVIKANDININNNMNSLKIDDVEALAEEDLIFDWQKYLIVFLSIF